MVLIKIDVDGSVVYLNPAHITAVTQSGDGIRVLMSDGVAHVVSAITPKKFIQQLAAAEHLTVTE